MDKLQPIIRNQFWILSGLLIPLILYGYYSANSSLKAATAERIKTLETVKSGVSSGNEPNEDYVKKLEHINKFLDSSVQDAIVDLWRTQQARMKWPQAVADRVPEEFMAEFDQQVPFIYKGIYPQLIKKLQARVQPVKPLQTQSGSPMGPMGPMGPMNRPKVTAESTRNQKVILAGMVPHAKFGQFGISSQEMWDAQIDIWMVEILFDAIVKMNRDKESISEAIIRRIDKIELMGGTGEKVTKDAAAGGEGGGEMGMMDPMMMEGMGGGGGQSAAVAAPTSISFLPSEEFGMAVEGAGGGGEMGMMGADMAMSPDGGGASGPTPPKRYIGETEDAPFLERGFYLSVIIKQNKIADFIVTLANSDWPVQVRRFQVGVNPYRVDLPRNSGNFGGMGIDGMGMEGMGMGMGMGMGQSDARMGSEMGMGMGMGTDSGKTGLPNSYGAAVPEFATGALNHPDLVQLDLCGIITMYKQPKEALEAVKMRDAEQAATQAPSAANETQINQASPGEGGTPSSANPETGVAPSTDSAAPAAESPQPDGTTSVPPGALETAPATEAPGAPAAAATPTP